MSNFKLVVVRTDGLHHDSTFAGWHSETTMIAAWRSTLEDKRTLFAVWFDGEQSAHSSDCVWTERQRFSAAE